MAMSEAERLFSAIKADDISEVATLIRAEPALAAAVDSYGVSAVMLAVYYGRQNILDKLLACGIELNLWEASAVGQKERVIELLEQHPTVVNAFSPDGFTPLGLSVFFGHPAVME